jgi:DNA-binding CsgD family transcriptional regulator
VLVDPHAEDAAQMAAREIDWTELMEGMNARDVTILMMAAGQLSNAELSRRWGVSCARVSQLKAELGRQVKLRWGDGALADAVAEPGWLRGSVRAARERRLRWMW